MYIHRTFPAKKLASILYTYFNWRDFKTTTNFSDPYTLEKKLFHIYTIVLYIQQRNILIGFLERITYLSQLEDHNR